MLTIPISLLFFTSTKGHWGFKDIYLSTLAHLARQIPLEQFAVKVAHLKVSPGDELLAETMQAELEIRGFKVIATVGSWKRGADHGLRYMEDVIKVSKELSIYGCPHVMWCEDDFVITPHKTDLPHLLHRMTTLVDSSPDILSCRLMSAGNLPTYPRIKDDGDLFYSPHFAFQPSILRSRDFYLAAKVIEENWDKIQNVHCEMLWALVLSPFSRSDCKHAVWFPDYAECVHLGEEGFPAIKAALDL